MDIPEYTFKEVGYSGSLQDIANILEYPQEQVLFSGKALRIATGCMPSKGPGGTSPNPKCPLCVCINN